LIRNYLTLPSDLNVSRTRVYEVFTSSRTACCTSGKVPRGIQHTRYPMVHPTYMVPLRHLSGTGRGYSSVSCGANAITNDTELFFLSRFSYTCAYETARKARVIYGGIERIVNRFYSANEEEHLERRIRTTNLGCVSIQRSALSFMAYYLTR